MLTISATDFFSNPGKSNQDVQRDTIQVTSYGRPVGYYISAQDFEEIEKIRAGRKRVYQTKHLPDEEWQSILESMPAEDATAIMNGERKVTRRVYEPNDPDYPIVADDDE